MCDERIAIKWKMYITVITPVFIGGAVAWTLRRNEEELLLDA